MAARFHPTLANDATGTNTPANLRALMDDLDRAGASDRFPSAMHASMAHDDGSRVAGWWATEGGYVQGTIEAPDGSRFHGTADERHGLEGTLTMSGAGCSWVFASQAARTWVDAVMLKTGTPPVRPRGDLGGGRVVGIDGRWDRFGAGGGTLLCADGTRRSAKWTRWLTVVVVSRERHSARPTDIV
ncbi:hypothetical protein pkur_cds_749 [Pandoravirus kuranda]|uniref:Uncharacterized protein n=1 Tax=Pandoravirus kuranda TaxID=3019033 RepID=A0AA95J4N9_9VIRU|nr:hypothetical protein pkur_cds_749 [Pandoravirus kuranda]